MKPKKRIGKKAMELSVNFIVILIIALLIFSGGIFFTNKFMDATINMKDRIDENTEKEIQRLIVQGEKTAIPFSKIELKRGQRHIFGLGIMNIFREYKQFYVEMSFNNAYNPDNSQMNDFDVGYINQNWIFTDQGLIELDPNEDTIVPIDVRAYTDMAYEEHTRDGLYVFDVCVCDGPCNGCPPIPASKLYGSIKKLYIEID